MCLLPFSLEDALYIIPMDNLYYVAYTTLLQNINLEDDVLYLRLW